MYPSRSGIGAPCGWGATHAKGNCGRFLSSIAAWFNPAVPPVYPQRGFRLPAGATEVVLVRHGASEAAVPGEPFPMLDGHGDPALSPDGEAQALAVAERLAADPPAALFVTPLRRGGRGPRPRPPGGGRGGPGGGGGGPPPPPAALFGPPRGRPAMTAAPLVERSALRPVVVPDLREVSLGEWEGGEFRIRMAEGDPVALRAVAEERWDVIPGAEDMEGFGRRVRAGIEAVVAAAGPDVSVAAVVHGGVIGEACRQATDSRPFAFVHADNGSLTRLVVVAGGPWLLRSFNDTAHLA